METPGSGARRAEAAPVSMNATNAASPARQSGRVKRTGIVLLTARNHWHEGSYLRAAGRSACGDRGTLAGEMPLVRRSAKDFVKETSALAEEIEGRLDHE